MPDAYLCAHCQSTALMHRMNNMQCLHCGNLTDMDGFMIPVEPVFAGENPHNRRPT